MNSLSMNPRGKFYSALCLSQACSADSNQRHSMLESEPQSAQGAGSPPNRALIAAFNAVQMTGLVLLLAIILTAWLAPSVKRSIAWFNVIVSWIFSASSFLLLMGRQTGPEPPFGLCLFQSMLIYAAPSMYCA